MSDRQRLRRLIELLEARYSGISDESHSRIENIDLLTPRSDDEIGLFQAAADQHENLLQALDDESTAVRREVDHLRLVGARHHNRRRPAVNLPFEILGEIFEAAYLTQESLHKRGSNALRGTRGTICLTCAQWRSAALQHPALWSSIIVLCSKRATRYRQPRFPNPSLIPLEAQRAGGLLLALSISIDDVHSVDNVLSELENIIQRCGHLHIWVTDLAPIIEQRLLIPLASSHNLTRMDSSDDKSAWHTIQLPIFPSLQSLNIVGGGEVKILDSLTACNITRLHVNDCVIHIDSLRRLFNACRELRTLSCEDLGVVDDDLGQDLSLQPYIASAFHSLQNLRLRGVSAYSLFMGLCAPELMFLALSDISEDFFAIPQFLTSLVCDNLRAVLFSDNYRLPERDPALSKAMTSFMRAHCELAVVHSDLDSELVECLGDWTSSGPYFTNLRELHVDNGGGGKHTDLALARRLLEMRRDHSPPLQPPLTLYLPNGSSVTEPDQLSLEMMYHDAPRHTQGFAGDEQFWKGYEGACISSMIDR